MELFFILLRQLITMAIFMAVGYVLFRTRKVTKETNTALNSLLMYVTLPATLLNSFMTERTPEKLKGFLLAFLLSAIAMAVSLAVSHFAFRRKPEDQFGASYSNAGFMGIPIVTAVAGAEAVFYIAPFVLFVNVLQWTAGVFTMTGSLKEVKPKKLLTIPILYGAAIGVLLFLLQIPVPSVLRTAVSSLAACNGPVAMLVLGVYFAQVDIKGIFTTGSYYLVVLVRLIVIPVITGLVFLLIPADPLIKVIVMVAAAAPIGSMVSVIADIFGRDHNLATQEVCLTTLLSIITMPVIVALFSALFGYH